MDDEKSNQNPEQTGTSKKLLASPREIHKYFGGLFSEDQIEQIVVLWINDGGKIIDVETIRRGTASFNSPEDVFCGAFAPYSKGIVLLRNHISGNPEPDSEDIKLTENFSKAGNEFGIQVYDFIIIAGDKYASFTERGLL